MKKRIDILLWEKKSVSSRSRAQLLIRQGKILYDGQKILKCGELVEVDGEISIEGEYSYVGRGHVKLKEAIQVFQVDPMNKIVADLGASTGGFTEYLLSSGASLSYAIDVGHDQLAPQLRVDPRVHNLEGINIKFPISLPIKVDLCVVDLSFISLRIVLENIFSLLKEGGELIVLFKPQFEVGKGALGKKGIVKDGKILLESLLSFNSWCQEKKWFAVNFTPSPIEGKSGNREFFFYFKKFSPEENNLFCQSEGAQLVSKKILELGIN